MTSTSACTIWRLAFSNHQIDLYARQVVSYSRQNESLRYIYFPCMASSAFRRDEETISWPKSKQMAMTFLSRQSAATMGIMA